MWFKHARRSAAQLERLAQLLLTYTGATVLMALMVLTCVDVFRRYLFDNPISGSFEITEMLLAAVIFLGLPLVSLRNQHVTVDLFDALTPDWLFKMQHLSASAFSAFCTAYLAWRLWLHAELLMTAGETTTQLRIPLGWLLYGMSAMMTVTSLAFLASGVRPPERSVTKESVP